MPNSLQSGTVYFVPDACWLRLVVHTFAVYQLIPKLNAYSVDTKSVYFLTSYLEKQSEE